MLSAPRLFTSESVAAGHPDKVCDQIADGVLDEVLRHDPEGRVACEVFAPGGGRIIVGGEITMAGRVEVERVAREVVEAIGYTDPASGLDARSLLVEDLIKPQSPDIARGVGAEREQGAGDSGMVFGFAVDEGPEHMPLPITLAHGLARRLAEARKDGTLPYLRPDGKAQVTVEYDEEGKPKGVYAVVVSAQHAEGVERGQIEEDIRARVIAPVLEKWLTPSTACHVNPTGRFVIGGPAGDTGLTGRKPVVDTYGGGTWRFRAAHGGGTFSGKDPSKVDRSAAYLARYAAKNVVAAGLAEACEVQIAYAIGRAEPVAVGVNTFGTGTTPDEEILRRVREAVPFKPAEIIRRLGLKRPIYLPTASFGHFGRPEFPWERTDAADALRG